MSALSKKTKWCGDLWRCRMANEFYTVRETFHRWLNECPVSWNRDSTDDDGDNEIQVIGFTVPKEDKDG